MPKTPPLTPGLYRGQAYPGPGGEIAPCCLPVLLSAWPACNEVASRQAPNSPITAQLLWVLVWTVSPYCLQGRPYMTPGSASIEKVDILARLLTRLMHTSGLERAIVLCCLRGHPAYTSDPDWVRNTLQSQRYLAAVEATFQWAHDTRPWFGVPAPVRHRCHKPPYARYRQSLPPDGATLLFDLFDTEAESHV
jgi:hypothetical protein